MRSVSEQPKSLWLAARLCRVMPQFITSADLDAAAAELRRLSAENESLRQIVQDFPPVEAELREVSDRAHRLEAQRDALLEALKRLCSKQPRTSQQIDADWDNARAAIKAVEGEKA